MREKLLELYAEWLNEIKAERFKLLSDKFSNPYFVSIPDGWESAEHRIMIVGEEGYGKWGCGKADGWSADDIEKIQRYNYETVAEILDRGADRRKFWKRFIEVYKSGYPCIWNNIDKIHFLEKRKGKYALTKEERIYLHSTNIKILKREIEILTPDVVVFFGWYYNSLVNELPEICNKLYPDGEGDNSLWKKNVCKITEKDIDYIFTYHPSWRGKYKPADYEERVIECIKNCLN